MLRAGQQKRARRSRLAAQRFQASRSGPVVLDSQPSGSGAVDNQDLEAAQSRGVAGMATNLAVPGLPFGQACREVGFGKNRGEQSAEDVGRNAEAAEPAKEEVGNQADAAEFATEGGGLGKNRGSEPEAEDVGYEAEAVEPAKKKGGLGINCGERGALGISHGAQGAERRRDPQRAWRGGGRRPRLVSFVALGYRFKARGCPPQLGNS